jgi:triosephosphate isomerase
MDFLLVANWKMNGNCQIALEYKKVIEEYLHSTKGCELVICPPFPYLEMLKSEKYHLGAQNVSNIPGFGSYTGEVSSAMLKDIGCKYVIIGHSERRSLEFSLIASKIRNSLNDGLDVILCVGETLEERESGKYLVSIFEQLAKSLPKDISSISVAYEPIWAIGSGKMISEQDLQEVYYAIKGFLKENYSYFREQQFRFMYGGSINSDNVNKFIGNIQINGLLIGSASLNYSEIIRIMDVIC